MDALSGTAPINFLVLSIQQMSINRFAYHRHEAEEVAYLNSNNIVA